MAGILLTRKRVHSFLTGLGFSPTKEVVHGESGKHLIWKTSWGYHFSVPDEDHACATWTLSDIVSAVEATRPKKPDC